jgi:hypothetical protein
MKHKIIFKPLQRSLKFLLLLSLFFGISNCKRDDGCNKAYETYFDSSFFDSSELVLIPDWVGDSLFYYSNEGDTAYLHCYSRYYGFRPDVGGSKNVTCEYYEYYHYPFYLYYFESNVPELDVMQIEIYKESLMNRSKEKAKSYLVAKKMVDFPLELLGSDSLANDSIILEDGSLEKGFLSATSSYSLNLRIGFLRIKRLNGKKWTLYRYTLAN